MKKVIIIKASVGGNYNYFKFPPVSGHGGSHNKKARKIFRDNNNKLLFALRTLCDEPTRLDPARRSCLLPYSENAKCKIKQKKFYIKPQLSSSLTKNFFTVY